jgi:type VI secretion system secreted protein VgrG
MGIAVPLMVAGLVGREVAEVGFADERLSMSVRAFSIHEGIDRTFEVLVTVGSMEADLDLDRVAGRASAFRILGRDGSAPLRVWSGVCREIEQLGVEEDGLSIYLVRIVPEFWRLTQRTTRRIFQHVTAIDIATTILKEWGLEAELRLQGAEFPRHEYRVQLDESDFAFVCRQLEEAGISYWFEPGEPKKVGDALLERMKLVFGVEPQRAAPRRSEVPLRSNAAHVLTGPYVRDVRVSRSVRPGRYALRGHEFRVSPELQLLAEAQAQHELERRYENYRYAPASFLSESSEAGTGVAELDERAAMSLAQIGLERQRTGRVLVRFATNIVDLLPGTVLSMSGHPRAELCAPEALLVVGAEWQGAVDGEWQIAMEAVPAREAYRAQLVTPKPRALGLESAIVVGAATGDDEVHTDEHGRIKVHFHWDREGKFDESASSWLRVSQGWAGNGYGMVQLPRVGTEVLVGFFDGDPDQPLVVGRAFNRVANHPYPLPQNRTKTVWRSSSTPGGEGFNELSFEDKAGEEVVHVRAQRDLETIALNDERSSVGANRQTSVRRNDRFVVGGDRSEEVRGAHSIRVGGRHTEIFEGGSESRSGARTGITMEDGKIVISNGQASIVLDGPIVRIDAASNIWLRSDRLVTISSKSVTIDKNVSINQHETVPAEVAKLAPPPSSEPQAAPPAANKLPPAVPPFDSHKFYEDLLAQAGVKVKLPKHLPVPDSVNEQLEHFALVAHKAGVVKAELASPKLYSDMKQRLSDRLDAEKARLTAMGDSIRSTFDKDRDHLGELRSKLAARYSVEQENLAKLKTDLGDVFSGKHGGFIDSTKALYGVLKDQAAHVMALRKDVLAMIEEEKRFLNETVGEWKAIADEINGYLEGMKMLVENPKDALLDLALGPDRQLGKDLASLAEEFGYGDEVANFFGVGADAAPPGSPAAVPTAAGSVHASMTSVSAMHAPSAPAIGSLIGGKGSGAMPSVGSSGSLVHAADASPKALASMHAPVGGAATAKGGLVVSRNGGLASHDLVTAVGPQQVGFLQSPSEGQLMVIPSEKAVPLDPALVNAKLVEAQLAGQPQQAAMNGVLEANGYAVYERAWGDWSGPFVQAASEAQA